MIGYLLCFIFGLSIGFLVAWIYEEYKDRMNDKIRVAIRDEKIRCLESKIKELKEKCGDE